jgi:predicted transcriptional regulator
MASENSPEGESGSAGVGDEGRDVRDRLERKADRAVENFDQGIVDLLSWVLDTETRARIYVYLRRHERSTSDEVAEGTGLYPSTVREALAQFYEEGTVEREKRESGGAGNNPYEYRAIAPSELVGEIVEDIQSELNAVFNLDREANGDTSGPVTITVDTDEAVDEDGTREET